MEAADEGAHGGAPLSASHRLVLLAGLDGGPCQPAPCLACTTCGECRAHPHPRIIFKCLYRCSHRLATLAGLDGALPASPLPSLDHVWECLADLLRSGSRWAHSQGVLWLYLVLLTAAQHHMRLHPGVHHMALRSIDTCLAREAVQLITVLCALSSQGGCASAAGQQAAAACATTALQVHRVSGPARLPAWEDRPCWRQWAASQPLLRLAAVAWQRRDTLHYCACRGSCSWRAGAATPSARRGRRQPHPTRLPVAAAHLPAAAGRLPAQALLHAASPCCLRPQRTAHLAPSDVLPLQTPSVPLARPRLRAQARAS